MPIVKGKKRKGGMTDQPQAESGVKSTTPEPVPSSNKDASETQSAEASPQGDSQTQQVAEPVLPEGVKERTSEQFEKLKSQLAEERERRMSYERMFNRTPVSQTPTSQTPDWYDPENEQIRVNPLHNKILTLEQRLDQAARTIQQYQSQDDKKQEDEAYSAYPELDPKSGDKFSDEFHEAAVSYLASSFAKGKNITLKQAADAIVSIGNRGLKKAEESGAKKALESLTPKEQASLEATGRSDKRPQVSMDDLQQRSRQGDVMAVMERLKNIPPVGR